MIDQSITCFKYRRTIAAETCLDTGALYFSRPDALNDIFEATYEHASAEMVLKKIEETYNKIYGTYKKSEIAFSKIEEEMFRVNADENNRLKEATEKMGIFSAAKRADDQAMWAYYAQGVEKERSEEKNTYVEDRKGACFELEWTPEVLREHQIYVRDVEYTKEARIHNRADDLHEILLDVASESQNFTMEDLKEFSLGLPCRRYWGIITASRAVSIKHEDWSHEKEIRLLVPNYGKCNVLEKVLKKVYITQIKGNENIINLVREKYPRAEIFLQKFDKGIEKI